MTTDKQDLHALFPKDSSDQAVVHTAFSMMQAYHQSRLRLINTVLADFPTAYTRELARLWHNLRAESPDESQAFKRLVQHIETQLEQGALFAEMPRFSGEHPGASGHSAD